MKRILASAVLASMLVFSTGCASVLMFNAQTAGKNDPGSKPMGGQSIVSTASYDILGPVSATGSSNILVGIVTSGNEGYGLLLEQARAQYGNDAHAVMYVTASYEYSGILFPILGEITTSYSGVAVSLNSIDAVESF